MELQSMPGELIGTKNNDGVFYVTWNDGDEKGRERALNTAAAALGEDVIHTTSSTIHDRVGPGKTSIRDSFTRSDYEAYRPDTAIPTKDRDKMALAVNNYENIGLIRNIMDLMADFAVQGIDINHPVAKDERFLKKWFHKTVKGKERSERFVGLLALMGNVAVQRHYGKLTIGQAKKMRAVGEENIEPDTPTKKRRIPCRYTFLNPINLEPIEPELTLFTGIKSQFSINVPNRIRTLLKGRKSLGKYEAEALKRIPEEVKREIAKGATKIPLPPEEVRAFYYKKNDWKTWATPMTHSIQTQLNLLQKMWLADMAALDGAISCIRVWKLGSLEHRISPGPALFRALSQMLQQNVGGGVLDLVWGADIELLETSTEVHRFLGETKYAPVLSAIYAGLGIPPTLTGSEAGGGFTNNFISLKTLVERLQYFRDRLIEWWQEELQIVQDAMGIKRKATLVFDQMSLTDEAAEKRLLIDLADRGLISWESLQERFNLVPEIESVRYKREKKAREKGKMPEQGGPFYSPEKDFDLKKIYAQLGHLAPSEVGLDLEPRKEGELSPSEMTASESGDDDVAGTSGQGRPPGRKDSQKRKARTPKPQTSPGVQRAYMERIGWADRAQHQIDKELTPAFLHCVGKKSKRELSQSDMERLEKMKLGLLFSVPPGEQITKEHIKASIANPLTIPGRVTELLKDAYREEEKEPTLDIKHRFQSFAFAAWHLGELE